jgi:hypothetical protein
MERRRAHTLTLSTIERLKNKKKRKKTCFALIYLVPLSFTDYSFEIGIIKKKKEEEEAEKKRENRLRLSHRVVFYH